MIIFACVYVRTSNWNNLFSMFLLNNCNNFLAVKMTTETTCLTASPDKQDNQIIEQVKRKLGDHSRPLKTVVLFGKQFSCSLFDADKATY